MKSKLINHNPSIDWSQNSKDIFRSYKKRLSDRINVNGNILGNDCFHDKTVIHNSNKLSWYVFLSRNNKILPINVFNLIDLENLKKLFTQADNFNAFAHDLKSMLMYHFWSRAEYEIILTDLLPSISKLEAQRITDKISDINHHECITLTLSRKIDAYNQIMINWPQFLNYTWSFLKKTQKIK